ncbi:hypothetical protein [Hymenobacter properus]|uniref:DUF4890 domain-containing protein n=1 Tax=Hymenobacter properus TaxID=2791026 RepID=A0A931BIY8_9BACT|nr:hypothetical protein [Hymenobacter properus]MBF9143147.1 hypothetical protein [Hymenobacter properus]MBR7721955.1 hypothetical protein [Microvirga sp. SRT04]
MKFFFAAALLSGLSFGATSVAQAQTGPAFPTPSQGSSEANARSTSGTNALELARNQRRAAMTPEEIKRDQQLELLEARTGNTSFGGRNGGPERQFDSNRSGSGFMVKKFKGKKGFMEQKRGQSHPIGGSNPAGKPLVHKHKSKHKFLFF